MGYNVLLVDDSAIVRKVMLKTFGMTSIPVNAFYEAENGQVALDLLSKTWVDIIFLDINMPVMNGMEFMAKLRENPTFTDIPIVIVSTEGSKERRNELEQAGVKVYLRKPVTAELLVETINSLLGGN